VLPFHEAELFRRFPSREYADGLHVAEISLAGGHDSVLSTSQDREGMAADHG
jgi:N-acyl homoserine lactone hydrolase